MLLSVIPFSLQRISMLLEYLESYTKFISTLINLNKKYNQIINQTYSITRTCIFFFFG
jgi:hypothetical protein